MRPPRLAALAALCGTAVLAGWAGVEHFASPSIENTAAPIEDSSATSASAVVEISDSPQVPAMGDGGPSVSEAIADEALPDSPPVPVPRPETPPVQLAYANTADPAQSDAKETARPVETADECVLTERCIDQYLWSVYQRAPKVDTIKVPERIKVTVKKKGKTKTVTKTITKLVDEDFTWKDPKAAEKAGMPLMDYVIGGMDRSFKRKLYGTLRALDDVGLAPGITSGFRDDYRQALASGKKAATDSSYHGGSRRGGYGHGLAADLVSVKGETRAQRWLSSEALWKWIDAHGQDYGIGRPYLDRDPPHVGPIDGKEYVVKRGLVLAKAQRSAPTKAQRVALQTNKTHGPAARGDQSKIKRAKTESPKAKSI